MTTTLTRRTARLVAVLGAVPVALALFAGGSASAQKSATFTTVTAPVGAESIGTSVDNSLATDRSYAPLVDGTLSNGGKVAGSNMTPADTKTPGGQMKTRDVLRGKGPGNNNGYECDGNHGIGDGNPAHSNPCPSTSIY